MNNVKRYTRNILNLVDMAAIIFSFFAAYLLRFTIVDKIYDKVPLSPVLGDYLIFLLLSFLSYFIVNELYIFRNDDLVKQSSFKIFTESIKTGLFTASIVLLALNFLKSNVLYSRLFEVIYIGLLILMMFIFRSVAKGILVDYFQKTEAAEKIVIVASKSNVYDVLNKCVKEYDWRNKVVGIVFENDEFINDEVKDLPYPVLGTTEDLEHSLDNSIYDSILLALTQDRTEKKKWIKYFQNIGKVVHVYVREYDYYDSYRSLDSVGDMAVVSYRAFSPMPKRQLIIKRFTDILLSLLLLPFFAILIIIVKLAYAFAGERNVIIPRVRVGKNNIRYYQYRFRVYRADAEQRIKEGKNPYSGIGWLLRKTHFDGAPMLLNILGGDMSFVGPKAPNLSKYIRMNAQERNALSIKPGIMGYWSLKSDLDVINEDDQKYMSNWSPIRDIGIWALMVLRYFSGQSLRIDGDTHVEEEIAFCNSILEEEKGVSYDASLYTKRPNFLYVAIKRIFDIVASLALLIVAFIPMVIIALLITVDDGGNPIYKHRRVGKNGKYVDIYKFRSMVQNAGDIEKLLTPEQLEQYQKEFKVDNDPRITRIGNFIRKTSIDELPQIFNILKGELSVVGPRPLLEKELKENYSDIEIAKFLSVTPGLTGYWQAYARNNATYETGQRQKMEMYYIDHQGILMDIKILFKTVLTVLKRSGAK